MQRQARVHVTGLGIVSALGPDLAAFRDALFEGRSGIRRGTRQPRAIAEIDPAPSAARIAALAGSDQAAARIARILRRSPWPLQLAVESALAAWRMAAATQPPDGAAVGLVLAGNNVSSAYCFEQTRQFLEGGAALPSFALHGLDTDHLGTISEVLGLAGPGFTVGAAAASGNAALNEAFQMVRCGRLEACLVVGPVAVLSPPELAALEALGAAADGRMADTPERSCRPFDRDRHGFVPGQAAAAVLLEADRSVARRGAASLAEILGGSNCMAATRLPTPSLGNEAQAMRLALADAGVAPAEIDYINAHATASVSGDEAELRAIEAVFDGHLDRIPVNSTKSFTGHCWHTAGLVELVAVIVQMQAQRLHANLNLDAPLDSRCRLVGPASVPARLRTALSNGFGFGGLAACLVIRHGGRDG